MQSGLGDEAELDVLGYRSSASSGVGAELSDHFGIGCVLGVSCTPLAPRNKEARQRSSGRAILVLTLPICQPASWEVPLCSAENGAKFNPPKASWTLYGGVVRPKSQARFGLDRPNHDDPIQIEAIPVRPGRPYGRSSVRGICREIGQFGLRFYFSRVTKRKSAWQT